MSNLVLYSIPAFLVLIALELVWARRHPELPGYEMRDTVASLSLGIANVAVSAGAKFPDGMLLAGPPAEIKRVVAGSGAEMWVQANPHAYAELAQRHSAGITYLGD